MEFRTWHFSILVFVAIVLVFNLWLSYYFINAGRSQLYLVQPSLGEGLVSYFPLDQDNGTIASNLASNHNGSVVNNARWLSNGQCSPLQHSCILFSGTNQSIILPYQRLGSSFTYSVWFNLQSLNFQYAPLLSFMSALIVIRPQASGFYYYPDITKPEVAVSYSMKILQWYDLVVTQNNQSYAIYVNGAPVESGSTYEVNQSKVYPSGINIDALVSTNLNAIDAQLRIYNRSLSSSEAESLFISSTPVAESFVTNLSYMPWFTFSWIAVTTTGLIIHRHRFDVAVFKTLVFNLTFVFVSGFAILIITASLALIIEESSLSNSLSLYAFYCLIAGFVSHISNIDNHADRSENP